LKFKGAWIKHGLRAISLALLLNSTASADTEIFTNQSVIKWTLILICLALSGLIVAVLVIYMRYSNQANPSMDKRPHDYSSGGKMDITLENADGNEHLHVQEKMVKEKLPKSKSHVELEKITAVLANPSTGIRRVLLVGVEVFLMEKAEQFLKEQGFEVLKEFSEERALDRARAFHPDILINQYWEEKDILDAHHLYHALRADPEISSTAYICLVSRDLRFEAIQELGNGHIIAYMDSAEIIRKLRALCDYFRPLS